MSRKLPNQISYMPIYFNQPQKFNTSTDKKISWGVTPKLPSLNNKRRGSPQHPIKIVQIVNTPQK